MIIADSNISMASAHSYAEQEAKKTELKVWIGPRPIEEPAEGVRRPLADTLRLSDEARTRFESMKKRLLHGRCRREIDIPGGADNKTFLKKLLIEALTGRKIKVMDVNPVKPGEPEAVNPGEGEAPAREDWGMEYKSTVVRAEFETSTFSASGTIKTADGEEISFSLELQMERVSVTSTETSVRAGNAIDPLMVNFGGKAADLTSARFNFDLDSDGESELIPFAGAGSGFLAIDLNRDGKVNNGGELFGPSTGNGFTELAAHDADGNSWIDEADAVYNDLYVWTKDSGGSDSLTSLKDLNIGAIYLASAETGFEVRDAGNTMNGQVRRTGLFLSEDLTPGVIQQIDLVV